MCALYGYHISNNKSLNLRLEGPLSQKNIFNFIGYKDIFPLSFYFKIKVLNKILLENLVLFPFYVKNEKIVIWNERMKENYIKFCYEKRANKNLSHEEFNLALTSFIKYLKEEFETIGIRITEK